MRPPVSGLTWGFSSILEGLFTQPVGRKGLECPGYLITAGR